MRNILMIFSVFLATSLQSQISDSLTFYADVMRHAEEPSHREWAADQFRTQLLSSLTEKDFKANESIQRWVSVLSPKDESFTFYSWHLDGAEGVSYYGIIQLEDGTILQLQNEEINYMESEYDEFSDKNWPGALYYKMILAEKNTYILLGINASHPENNIKVAESFRIEDSEVTFGVPVFYMDQDSIRPDVRNRYIIQYSKKSAARLTYDQNESLIFFDNLIPLETMEDRDQVSWVPDGSYSGFRQLDGRWVFQDKLFTQTMSEPPSQRTTTDEPVIKRDILGRPKR